MISRVRKRLRSLPIGKHLSLSIWLTDTIIVVFFMLLILLFLLYYLYSSEEKQASFTLKNASVQIETWIEEVSARNRMIATDLNLQNIIKRYTSVDYKTKLSDRDYFRNILSNSVSSEMYVVNAALYLKDADKTFTLDFNDMSLKQHYTESKWLASLLDGKIYQYQGWESSGLSESRVYVISTAIRSMQTGDILGIIYTELSPQKFDNVYSAFLQDSNLKEWENDHHYIIGTKNNTYRKLFSEIEPLAITVEYHMNIQSLISTVFIVIICSALGLLLLSFALYYLCNGLSRWFVTRIHKLRDVTAELAKGNLGITIQDEYNDELTDLANSLNYMSTRIKQLVDENYLVRIKTQEAQLLALQLQINPHFIYNTLESISCMALVSDNYEIVNVVQAFSSMMRYAMQDSPVVQVSDETENARCYLAIQNTRFPDKIEAEFDIQKNCNNLCMLRLTLQPLLENAFIHGFSDIETGGRLKLSIKTRRNNLYILLSDNGSGMSEEKVVHTRAMMKLDALDTTKECYALRNLAQRLRISYGHKAKLLIHSELNVGTLILIKLPVAERNNYDNEEPVDL